MENADLIQLPTGKQIRMVSGTYFLITKLEAFDVRGGGDYQMSHDIEDIIAVLDGRPGIIEEVKRAEPELAGELSSRLKILLKDNRFIAAVSGHMPTDETSQARVSIIIEKMNKIVRIK